MGEHTYAGIHMVTWVISWKTVVKKVEGTLERTRGIGVGVGRMEI